MNERIKQLAHEAGLRFSTTGTVIAGDKIAIEIFAELMVKECIWEVVKDNEVPHNIQLLIGERFKQHFGVEE